MRLKTKIAIVFVLLVIVPMVGGVVISLRALSEYLSFQQYSVIRQTAEQLDELIRLEKEDVLAIAEVISGSRAVAEAIRERDISRLRALASLYQRLGRADIIEFRDAAGRVVLRTARRTPESSDGFSSHTSREATQPSVDIYPEGAEIVIRATAPVVSGAEPVGAVSVGERLSREFIERYKTEMGFEVAVLGRDRILYSTLQPLDIHLLPLASIESARKQFYGRTRVAGNPYTIAGYPLLRSDGTYQGALLLFQIETTFQAAVARARRAIGLAAAFAFLYALGVGYVVARKLQTPIAELLSKMHQVMKGNYDVEVEVKTQDEFRDLAEGFNTMLRQIRRSREHLRAQNQKLRAFARTLKRELELAGKVQSLLIPKEYADDRVDVRVQYFPMLDVGGDYAFFHVHDDGAGYFVIADVSGHGVAAALVMSRVSAEVENLVRSGVSVEHLLSHLNGFIFQNFSVSGMFVTLFCARVDFTEQQVEVANAGHPPQWLYRADLGQFVEFPARNLPLGAFSSDVFGQPLIRRTPFSVGDHLFLFTDGWIEADDPGGNPLGLERFRKFLAEAVSESAEQPLVHVVNAVKRYSGGRFKDDALLVTVRFRGDGNSIDLY